MNAKMKFEIKPSKSYVAIVDNQKNFKGWIHGSSEKNVIEKLGVLRESKLYGYGYIFHGRGNWKKESLMITKVRKTK